jgi:hypothetical protein
MNSENPNIDLGEPIRIGRQYEEPPYGFTAFAVGDYVVWISAINEARLGKVAGFFRCDEDGPHKGKWRVAVGNASPFLERVGVATFGIVAGPPE